jgi:hypothetical protein
MQVPWHDCIDSLGIVSSLLPSIRVIYVLLLLLDLDREEKYMCLLRV